MEYNVILIIVDKYIKQGYFIIYTEEIIAKELVRIYIKEVFIRYRILVKIISNRNLKFILEFQEIFMAE